MNENNKEKKQDNIKDTADENFVLDLDNGLIENENTLDVSAIMRMATDLLQSDLFINSAKDLSHFVQFPILNLPEIPENGMNTEFILLKEQLEKTYNELLAVKKDLTNVKENNQDLLERIIKLEKCFKTDKGLE